MEASSQPEFATAVIQDDLLDEWSVQTVLEMLAVMVLADELTQLESLTPRQKRQVWEATPEDVKLRLKQIKASTQVESRPMDRLERSTEEPEEPEEPEELNEPGALEELEEPEESLDEMGEAIDDIAAESIGFVNLPLLQKPYDLNVSSVEQTAQVGDWIVLKAEPRLTTSELVAVWKIVAIQGEQARIEAKGLGSRQYPMSWMVSYPLDELEF